MTHWFLTNWLILQLAGAKQMGSLLAGPNSEIWKNPWQMSFCAALLALKILQSEGKYLVIRLCSLSSHHMWHLAKMSHTATLSTPGLEGATPWLLTTLVTSCQYTWCKIDFNSNISDAHKGACFYTADINDFFLYSTIPIFQCIRVNIQYIPLWVFHEYILMPDYFDFQG